MTKIRTRENVLSPEESFEPVIVSSNSSQREVIRLTPPSTIVYTYVIDGPSGVGQ